MAGTPLTAASALTPDRLAASPLHLPGSRRRWTTANVDEGLPGTVTPLTWSMYFPPTEAAMRDCWVDLGVLPERERPVPDDIDGRFISVAYGHAISNVDLMGQMAARVPGGSAASMEQQLFGSVQGGGQPELTGLRKMRRYPMVLAKFPRALRRAMRDLEPRARATTAWWERAVFAPEPPSGQAAVRLLVEARRRFEGILSTHMVLAMAAQGVMGQVETLAAKAGLEGLQHELIKSEEGTAEFDLVRDLWLLSADRIDLDQFRYQRPARRDAGAGRRRRRCRRNPRQAVGVVTPAFGPIDCGCAPGGRELTSCAGHKKREKIG